MHLGFGDNASANCRLFEANKDEMLLHSRLVCSTSVASMLLIYDQVTQVPGTDVKSPRPASDANKNRDQA